MAAIAAKSPVVPQAVCRHGFGLAQHEVSRSFRDENGEQRWYRKLVTDDTGCPDQ